jgi:hypothetical protein
VLRNGLAASLALLLAAGCGGASPRAAARPGLPPALAHRWAGEAEQVAAALQANDGCAAQQAARSLVSEVDDAGNRIPARFRVTVMTAAATLADRIVCVQKPQKPQKPHGPPKRPKPPGHDHGHGHEGDGG